MRTVKVTCDYCGDKVFSPRSVCCRCNRDSCDSCGKYDPYDPHSLGESPDRYCNRCWDIGKPHSVSLRAAAANYDSLVESIQSAWTNECLRETNFLTENELSS